jgi:hypothetical protein
MIKIRFVPLAAALVATISLTACQTAPMMPMGGASAAAPGMAKHDHMAMMDAQMKTMQGMHDKMMAAKTPEERSKLMAEHMKTMQDSMKMMGDMKGMQGMPGMTGGMGARHQMMEKRMEMMQSMMQMMMDQMHAMPAK